ncbi:hypothetical protein D3C76_750180 [compost metagenome]
MREQFAEQVAAQLDFAAGEVEVLAQASAESVPPARAKHQAVVSAALAVSHLAAVLAESLATVEADLIPDLFGQRLGGHQQALYRQLITAQRRQVDRVALDRRYQPLAFDPRLQGTYFASAPLGDGAVLIEFHPHGLYRAGQATHQFGRLDGGDVGIEDCAIRAADAQLWRQLAGAKPAVVGFGQALFVEFVQVRAQAGFLLGVARCAIQHATFAVVAVDAFALQHLGNFIGDAVQQVVGGAPLFGRAAGEQAVFAQQVAHQPAAIAPGGTKACNLRFDDGDVQLRRQALEVVGGPQAGIASADDADVDVQVLLQRRAGAQRLIELVHPQADTAPCQHCSAPHW